MRFKYSLLAAQLVALTSFAQSTFNASGGTQIGTGGSLDYSIGDVFYSSPSGVGGSLTTSPVQSFELKSVGLFESLNLFNLSVYPNPTQDILCFNSGSNYTKGLTLSLNDIMGKTLEQKTVEGQYTTLNLVGLGNAVYFLIIQDGSTQLAAYKIIKN